MKNIVHTDQSNIITINKYSYIISAKDYTEFESPIDELYSLSDG